MKKYKFMYNRVIYNCFLYTIAVICILSSCDNKKNDRIKNIEALSFMKFYRETYLKKDKIVLLNSQPKHILSDCLFKVTFEMEFDKFEKKDFLNNPNVTKIIWDKKNVTNNSLLINNSDLPNTKIPKEWLKFREKYGEGYYTMSYPIVSNNFDYIIFYCEYNCGERCGYGKLGLYKKTYNGWKLIKYYCDWVS